MTTKIILALELKQFPEAKLRKIADCLEEESFENGHCIFKQGKFGTINEL